MNNKVAIGCLAWTVFMAFVGLLAVSALLAEDDALVSTLYSLAFVGSSLLGLSVAFWKATRSVPSERIEKRILYAFRTQAILMGMIILVIALYNFFVYGSGYPDNSLINENLFLSLAILLIEATLFFVIVAIHVGRIHLAFHIIMIIPSIAISIILFNLSISVFALIALLLITALLVFCVIRYAAHTKVRFYYVLGFLICWIIIAYAWLGNWYIAGF